jgi:glutamate/aspartate transport system substrate-binding protein
MTAIALLLMSYGGVVAQEQSPVLTKISESGTIRLGYRESSIPFSFIGNDGKPQGYAFDLCSRVIDIIGEKVGKKLEVAYVPVTTTNRIPLVANGTVDLVCETTTNKLSRQEQVSFGPTYFFTGTRIATKVGSGIKEAEDLAGKVVGVLQGSTNEQALRKLDGEKNLRLRLVYYKDYAEGFLLLQTGRVDAIVGDGAPMQVYAKTKMDDPKSYEIVGRFLTPDPYAPIFARGDREFELAVRRAFATLFRSGEAEKIFHKWFDSVDIPLDPTMSAAFLLQALPE